MHYQALPLEQPRTPTHKDCQIPFVRHRQFCAYRIDSDGEITFLGAKIDGTLHDSHGMFYAYNGHADNEEACVSASREYRKLDLGAIRY